MVGRAGTQGPASMRQSGVYRLGDSYSQIMFLSFDKGREASFTKTGRAER